MASSDEVVVHHAVAGRSTRLFDIVLFYMYALNQNITATKMHNIIIVRVVC